jgi:hypothetical protein
MLIVKLTYKIRYNAIFILIQDENLKLNKKI